MRFFSQVLLWVFVVASFAPLLPQGVDRADVPLPFSNGFVDLSPEALTVNPALVVQYASPWVSAAHRRIFWSIGEPLHLSSISALYNTCCSGVGVDFSLLSAPMEYRWFGSVSLCHRIGAPLTPTIAENRWGVFVGVNLGAVARGYRTDAFDLAQPDPLFLGATSKVGFVGGVGIAYRWRGGQVFAGAQNLTSPDMSLSGGDRVPPSLQLGATLRFGTAFLWLVGQYEPRYGDVWLDLSPVAAVDWRVHKKVALQGFVSSHSVGAGFVVTPAYDRGFGFCYRLSFPLDGLRVPSHSFGLQFRLPPPAPIFPDAKPLGWMFRGRPVVGETLRVGVVAGNVGRFRAPPMPVALKAGDTVMFAQARSLLPGESDTVWFSYPVGSAGDHRFSVEINRREPFASLATTFLEADIHNNASSAVFHVFAPPEPELLVRRGELRLIQLFSVREDEPLVPIFFFDFGDSTLPARFGRTVRIIGERLRQNPDVVLVLYGYVVEGEDDALAYARARSVKRAFVGLFPELEGRLLVSTTHDVRRKRAKKEKFQGTRLGRLYTAQENRRVELEADVVGFDRPLVSSVDSLSPQALDEVKRFLDRNDEVILVVKAPTLIEALGIKERLLERMGEVYADRVFSQQDTGFGLSLSAAGVIYRPPLVVQPREGYDVEPGWDRVELEIVPRSEAPVVEARIFVIRGVDTVWAAEGLEATWDWRVDGKLPPPGAKFKVFGLVRDSLGQLGRTNEAELSVVVRNINEVKQRLILLQFAFGGARSESEYTNARMEYVARRVVDRISAGNVDVVVAGHTDTVGTISGNQKLSVKRARQQLGVLRRYLRAILGFSTDEELDDWLRAHNATLTAKGFGMSQPFTITRLEDGREVPVCVGDNTLPEGRIKNRRVEILFLPKREL